MNEQETVDLIASLRAGRKVVQMEVRFDGAPAPQQANYGDAAYDLKAIGDTVMLPGETALIHTGLKLAIPHGYCGMVCSRSGLALKRGVFVMNAPGIIDAPFRGEIGVILHNAGQVAFEVKPGDRIAQLLIVKVEHPQFVFGVLDDTDRGAGGFGSSGQ